MQAAGDERGDLPRDQYPSGSALGADATRAFRRGAPEQPEGLPASEATQVLSRPAGPPTAPAGGAAGGGDGVDIAGGLDPYDRPDPIETADVLGPADGADQDDRGDRVSPVASADRHGPEQAGATQQLRRDRAAGSTQALRRDRAAGTTQPMRRGAPPPSPPPPRTGRGSAPRGGPRRRFLRKRWVLALLVIVVILIPVVTWGRVWYTARQDQRPVSDAIVVLGASQYDGRPSPIFEARLNHAAELYWDGVAPAIVTVGGNQPGDNFTEGEAGRNWLIEVGIPAEQVVAVPEGADTVDSLEAVAAVFEEFDWSSAVIVTDPWHALRSRVIAEDAGMEAATSPSRSGPAVQTRETQVWYITRETASLMYYRLFGESADIRVDAA